VPNLTYHLWEITSSKTFERLAEIQLMGDEEFYYLARNNDDGEYGNNPYRVNYTPNRERGRFQLVEGTIHTEYGTQLSASGILSEENWQDLLHRADAEWLLPLLHRIADGETVTTAEILAARDRQ